MRFPLIAYPGIAGVETTVSYRREAFCDYVNEKAQNSVPDTTASKMSELHFPPENRAFQLIFAPSGNLMVPFP
jgi:hypothetical protein